MKLDEILKGIKAKMMNSEDYYSEISKLVDLVVIQAMILGERVGTVVIEKDPDFNCFKVNGDECPQHFEEELYNQMLAFQNEDNYFYLRNK